MVQCVGAAFGILASAAGPVWAADPALPYGLNAHLPASALLDRVAAAGSAWMRVDFHGFMLEPAPGVYDWPLTDAVVSAVRARGLNTDATLAYPPAGAAGGQGPNTPPVAPQAWSRVV
jgi:hypothetical protein